MIQVDLPTWNELLLILPEIVLALGMCAVILLPMMPGVKRENSAMVAVGTFAAGLVAVIFSMFALQSGSASEAPASGLLKTLTIDPLSQSLKGIIYIFSIFVVLQWLSLGRSRVKPADQPDFVCLLVGAAFGMSLMASANHLLMIFIAIEAASLPSYALAGIHKRTVAGAEASAKYVIFGSVGSAIMLYGLSLIYGLTGSLAVPEVAATVAAMPMDGSGILMLTGLVGLGLGIAFKLSAVPMHYWCPEVFQGAAYEVVTFLSVASKAAAVCLLLRLLAELGAAMPTGAEGAVDSGLGQIVVGGVAVLGIATATLGNLLAIHQNQIKRLLAFSSIAHAGYMMMACAAAGAAGADADKVAGAVLFYIAVYAFMNLGAFTLAYLLQQQTGTGDIRQYAGIGRRSPVVAGLFAVVLLSLFGLPPLGGFLGKVMLATAMGELPSPMGMVLITALFINTAISLYYYVRPLYYLMVRQPSDDKTSESDTTGGLSVAGAGLAICVFAVAGILLSGLTNMPAHVANHLGQIDVGQQKTAGDGVAEVEGKFNP